MKSHLNLSNQSALSPFPFLTFVFHVIFFWIRLSGLITIFGLRSDFLGSKYVNAPPAIINGVLETANDLVFLISFNMFQLYLELWSFTSGNIYGYYMAIVIMIHNAVLTMFIPSTTSITVRFEYWIVLGIISAAFFVEALITIYMTYLRRYESSLDIFKKVGANPKVNSAFATRKILEAFGLINVFSSAALACKDFVIPSTRFTKPGILRFSYIIVTFVQQLFISVNFNDEDIIQRKIAVYLSFLKIPLIIGSIIWIAIAPAPKPGVTDSVEIFVIADALVESIAMNWFLVSDTKKFGSGVKEYLMFRTKKLDLSSFNTNK